MSSPALFLLILSKNEPINSSPGQKDKYVSLLFPVIKVKLANELLTSMNVLFSSVKYSILPPISP